jgi:uncharacterized membrane protein YphA (DoxX/SURF4 family)
MNTTLWIIQSLVAVIFLYSGIHKSIYSQQKLVSSGQTGVDGFPLVLIRFIGVSEIVGAAGITLPLLFNILPIFTVIAAVSLAIIMIPAAIIHHKRKEYKNVATNCILFIMCVFVAYGRMSVTG